MTKAKSPIGAPFGISYARVLSSKTRTELANALGYDATSALNDPKIRKCLQSVAHWLGYYPHGVEALDNEPAASVYIRELKAVRDNACKMLQLLNSPTKGINQFTRETLSAHFEEAVSITGPDGVDKACSGAGNLLVACNSALNAWAKEKKQGQGRKKSKARDTVLINLLDLYAAHSKKPHGPRGKTGFTERRSSFEQGEIDFVRAAFADIGKDGFKDDRGDRKWAALIRAAQLATAPQSTPRAREKAKK